MRKLYGIPFDFDQIYYSEIIGKYKGGYKFYTAKDFDVTTRDELKFRFERVRRLYGLLIYIKYRNSLGTLSAKLKAIRVMKIFYFELESSIDLKMNVKLTHLFNDIERECLRRNLNLTKFDKEFTSNPIDLKRMYSNQKDRYRRKSRYKVLV